MHLSGDRLGALRVSVQVEIDPVDVLRLDLDVELVAWRGLDFRRHLENRPCGKQLPGMLNQIDIFVENVVARHSVPFVRNDPQILELGSRLSTDP